MEASLMSDLVASQPIQALVEALPQTHHPIIEDHRVDVDSASAADVAALIDHTILKPDTTSEQIRQLCDEAKQHGFASVCVNLTWLTLCDQLLGDSPVKRCVVVGFPLGATLPAAKAYETTEALRLGAQEVDMVLNVGRMKDGDYATVYADINAVVDVAHAEGVLVKVILETFLLTDEEKVAACLIAQRAGADFVKTATGFNGGGATVEDVTLMRSVVGDALGVKASGGVRSGRDARAMIAAGATRIGASAGVSIIESFAEATQNKGHPNNRGHSNNNGATPGRINKEEKAGY